MQRCNHCGGSDWRLLYNYDAESAFDWIVCRACGTITKLRAALGVKS